MTTATISPAPATALASAKGGLSAKRSVLTEFSREQVESALIAAGGDPKSTDADIRRLTNVQIHMVKYDLARIDNEQFDDDQTAQLLDYFCTIR